MSRMKTSFCAMSNEISFPRQETWGGGKFVEKSMISVGNLSPELNEVWAREIYLGVVSGPSHASHNCLLTPPLPPTKKLLQLPLVSPLIQIPTRYSQV